MCWAAPHRPARPGHAQFQKKEPGVSHGLMDWGSYTSEAMSWSNIPHVQWTAAGRAGRLCTNVGGGEGGRAVAEGIDVRCDPWLNGKDSDCNAGDAWDTGLIPGLGRSPGGRHGSPLQYSCLEYPTDRGAWQAAVHGVTKSQTWLKRLSTHGLVSYQEKQQRVMTLATTLIKRVTSWAWGQVHRKVSHVNGCRRSRRWSGRECAETSRTVPLSGLTTPWEGTLHILWFHCRAPSPGVPVFSFPSPRVTDRGRCATWCGGSEVPLTSLVPSSPSLGAWWCVEFTVHALGSHWPRAPGPPSTLPLSLGFLTCKMVEWFHSSSASEILWCPNPCQGTHVVVMLLVWRPEQLCILGYLVFSSHQ